MAKVLIIEDEKRLADTLAYNLKREGYLVVLAYDGASGLSCARKEQPDLVILDLMLPVLPGMQVCRSLRAESAVPVLMLTAKDTEADKVAGLELGADDYVTKPFSMRELMARVSALLRRAGLAGERRIEVGDLSVDLSKHEVLLRGDAVHLTRKEFDLLAALASCKGRPVSRRALMETVWEDPFYDDHTLDVHIRWLREKIETDPSHPEYILTCRGVGYKLRP